MVYAQVSSDDVDRWTKQVLRFAFQYEKNENKICAYCACKNATEIIEYLSDEFQDVDLSFFFVNEKLNRKWTYVMKARMLQRRMWILMHFYCD